MHVVAGVGMGEVGEEENPTQLLQKVGMLLPEADSIDRDSLFPVAGTSGSDKAWSCSWASVTCGTQLAPREPPLKGKRPEDS